MEDRVKISGCSTVAPSPGNTGLNSQVYGEALTVSAFAAATGGLDNKNIITTSKK